MERKYHPGEFEKRVVDYCSEFGGMRNVHVHGDRAYTWRDEFYSKTGKSLAQLAKSTLPEKQMLTWKLHDSSAFDSECIEQRMMRMLDESKDLGVVEVWTTVDATYNTRLKSLEVAEKLKREYKGIKLLIGAYNPSGFKKIGVDKAERRFEIFEEAASRADFLMGLAEKDRKKQGNEDHIGESAHNCYMMRLARKLGKPVHFHVGQENRYSDNTLELLLTDIKHMQDDYWGADKREFPEVVAVHAISSACKPYEDFQETARRMVERDVSLICCPRAAVSMHQDKLLNVPTHNSIAPVWDFVLSGVKVKGLGVDNLDDIFVPASDSDIYKEAEYLAHALRLYDPRVIAKVMCGVDTDDFDKTTIRDIIFPNLSSPATSCLSAILK